MTSATAHQPAPRREDREIRDTSEIEHDLRDAIGMARALDTMLLFGQQESPFQPADYSAALKLLDHLTEDLARLHDDVYALMEAACPAEAEAPCRAATEEKGTQPVSTPDALGPAVLQLPRPAADFSNDVRDTERLIWALLAVFPKEVDVRLCGDEVSGVRQIAWCALERIERLQSDARILTDRDSEYWSARTAGGAAA